MANVPHLAWIEAQLCKDLSFGSSAADRKSSIFTDIGDMRLYLKKTNRETRNKWRLYLSIRTRKENGVEEDLKRGVCVAEYDGELSQDQAKEKAEYYVAEFIVKAVQDWNNQRG